MQHSLYAKPHFEGIEALAEAVSVMSIRLSSLFADEKNSPYLYIPFHAP
jgi:hypothetical protein